jgi:hypothetical protein
MAASTLGTAQPEPTLWPTVLSSVRDHLKALTCCRLNPFGATTRKVIEVDR